jgi:HSP20 family molecular chaperone IbpA
MNTFLLIFYPKILGNDWPKFRHIRNHLPSVNLKERQTKIEIELAVSGLKKKKILKLN